MSEYIYDENVEVWKDIEGYEGFYQVSDKSRVKSLERARLGNFGSVTKVKERILKYSISNNGYFRVELNKNCSARKFLIHRLVALCFCKNDNPINKNVINHIDGNKENNKANNLEWCSQSHNVLESLRLGLAKPSEKQKEAVRKAGLLSAGENHGQCKLTDSEVNKIRLIYSQGGISQQKLGDLFGVAASHISNIINNKKRARCTPIKISS